MQWGDLIRGLLKATNKGAKYTFLTDGGISLTEGPGYNIVIVKYGDFDIPGRVVLEGVTRKTVLEIAQKNSIGVHVQAIPVEMAF